MSARSLHVTPGPHSPLAQPEGAAVRGPSPRPTPLRPLLPRLRAELARIEALPADEQARYSESVSELRMMIEVMGKAEERQR